MKIIEFTEVTKQFAGQTILDKVSFSINKGEIVAILGPSGAGKSTLLRCMNLLTLPDQGRLQLGDAKFDFPGSLNKNKLQQARQQASMVFQHFNLWPHKTALENVALAPQVVLKRKKVQAQQQAYELLAQVGLSDKAQSYPQALSGGEQQRVGIARALAMQPDILLFDEPTASLDPEKSRDILAIMRQLTELQKTMIIVTHEVEFARQVAGRVLFLEKGRITIDDHADQAFSAACYPRLQQFIED